MYTVRMGKPKKSVHFLGVAGIGVSGLALWYKNLGWVVTGSDIAVSPVTEMLNRFGIKPEITADQFKRIPKDADLIIHTQAIDRSKITTTPGVVVKSYPEALGELTKDKFTVAVCGTHGKSTTAAMAGLLMLDAGLSPTVLVGTMLREFSNSNFHFGSSRYLVIEADEFRGAFLNYYPDIAIWTNVDNDHMDYFKNLDDAVGHFNAFIKHIPDNGFIIANRDDKNIKKVLSAQKNVIFYSLRDKESGRIRRLLKIPGEHNVANALAVLKLARVLHVPDEAAYGSIANYRGSWRRFELKGELNGAKVYDDYAHHPTEIKATLAAARAKFKGKNIWCVFQPHQYERLKFLFNDFSRAFKGADRALILPVYGVAGREGGNNGVDSKKLARAIKKQSKNADYMDGMKDAALYLKKNVNEKDIVIIMGAGNIWQIFEFLF